MSDRQLLADLAAAYAAAAERAAATTPTPDPAPAPEPAPAPTPTPAPAPAPAPEPAPAPTPTRATDPRLPYAVNLPEAPRSTESRGHPGGVISAPGVYELNSDTGAIVIRKGTRDVTINLNGHRAESITLGSWDGAPNTDQHQVRRVHIYNGSAGFIEASWQVGATDLHSHDIELESDGAVFKPRGHRTWLHDCKIHSNNAHAVWMGDMTALFDMQDLLIEDCEMTSNGAEAVLRVHDCYRAIVRRVDLSTLGINGAKHCMRYHTTGRNSRHLRSGELLPSGAARSGLPEERPAHNLAFLDSTISGPGNGLMYAHTSGERGIEDAWIDNVFIAARSPSMFQIPTDMARRVHTTNCRLEWTGWDPFDHYSNPANRPAGWTWENNVSWEAGTR